MEELRSLTVSDDRLDDCREALGPDLQDLIDASVASGFTIEETLIAISELVAEDFASAVKPERSLRRKIREWLQAHQISQI